MIVADSQEDYNRNYPYDVKQSTPLVASAAGFGRSTAPPGFQRLGKNSNPVPGGFEDSYLLFG